MKKLGKLLLAGAFVLALAGCGSSSSSSDDKTITVGATAVPHAEILNDVVKDILADEGWELKVVEFTDYVQPNQSLEDGDLDANYFQTLKYMQEVNEENSWHLKEVQGVHYEAMGVYSKNLTDISELKDGDEVLIPNDGSNEDRALNLLAKAGLIEYTSNVTDPESGITKKNVNIKITTLAAEEIANHVDDAVALVVNGNYALEASLKDKTNTLYSEEFTTEEAAPYINYLVVKEGNEETEKTQALIKAITDQKVKDYISEKYGKAVVATF
jgi:D-methionine transport system substrate-binding protein